MRQIDEVANAHEAGATWQHRFTVTDGDGNLVPDGTLNVHEEKPDGTTVDHAIGGGVVSAQAPSGTYDIDAPLTVQGDYYFQIQLTSGKYHTIYVPVLA